MKYISNMCLGRPHHVSPSGVFEVKKVFFDSISSDKLSFLNQKNLATNFAPSGRRPQAPGKICHGGVIDK